MTTKDDSYTENLTAASKRDGFWEGFVLGILISSGLVLLCLAIAYLLTEVASDLR